MSPCSHAQEHGRRCSANGQQTSSAVSTLSLRAALPHCCHWLSWPHLSCNWLRCRLATCAHSTQTPSKHTDTTLALQGSSPCIERQPGLRVGARAPISEIASNRCRIRWIKDLGVNPLRYRVLRRTAGGADYESNLRLTHHGKDS